MKQENRDDDRMLLLRTLDRMGVEIRRGALDTDGGLVRLGGQYVVFVRDGISGERERGLYCDALRKIGTGDVHIPPRVRELLGDEGWNGKEGTVDG
jgi:hypothetical protein